MSHHLEGAYRYQLTTFNHMAREGVASTSRGSARAGVVPPRVLGRPRGRGGVSGRNSSNASSGSSSNKIVIRPYQKPPQLPKNYYDDTARAILGKCLAVLQARLGMATGTAHSHGSSSDTGTQRTTTSTNSITNTGTGTGTGAGTTAAAAQSLSLQNAYTAAVHLVSHQYGARLYTDVVATMQEAALLVLTSSRSRKEIAESNYLLHQNQHLLEYVVKQYQAFVDFILLLQHVCLPLDRTWQWQWWENVDGNIQNKNTNNDNRTQNVAEEGAAPIEDVNSTKTDRRFLAPQGHALPVQTSSSSNGESQASDKTFQSPAFSASHFTMPSNQQMPPPTASLWHVGVSVFLRRLVTLQLDRVLYDQWLATLRQDWNGANTIPGVNSGVTTTSNYCNDDFSNRQYLQQVWYLWKDMGVLGKLPLQRDLEQYWSQVSNEWKSESSSAYPIKPFLNFCHAKLQHCLYWRPWLPAPWLWNILDVYLIHPHLNSEFLLAEANLFPVLSEYVLAGNTQRQQLFGLHPDREKADVDGINSCYRSQMTDTGLNPIQQLWILAGRLPGGQARVGQVIQNFARQQGLQRMGFPNALSTGKPSPVSTETGADPNHPNNLCKIVATPKNALLAAVSSSAVEDLLHLQDCLANMTELLPGAAAPNEPGTNNSSILSLKSVWEEVVNVDATPSLAEQLAKFLDATLRSNKKIETYQSHLGSTFDFGWLQRIIAGLFVPLQAKDLFEAFYKRDLAKRLLLNRVVSIDAEKQVCSLLKAECGTGYTSKIEGMFQDVEWSRETMLLYKQSAATTLSNSFVEVEVQVLTTGYWPVYPEYPNLQLPDDLEVQKEHFANHYKNKYQGRRMVWQYALGQCVVRANGFPKTYELLVSLCQAIVLIQFETADSILALPQLLNATGLEDRGEMERILLSLALGKDGTRILRKLDFDAEPGQRKKTRMNVDDRDRFAINTSFESNSRRVRINNITMKETKEERDKTVETVSRDRLYLIDAILVRIMKARKTILHQALIPQVLEQVKVPAQAADIKMRIESLIEREYMERDVKDRNRYNYMA